MSKDYYTVKDIAEELQVKEKAIRHLINTGQLPASKIARKWVVSAEDLKAFVKSQSNQE